MARAGIISLRLQFLPTTGNITTLPQRSASARGAGRLNTGKDITRARARPSGHDPTYFASEKNHSHPDGHRGFAADAGANTRGAGPRQAGPAPGQDGLLFLAEGPPQPAPA